MLLAVRRGTDAAIRHTRRRRGTALSTLKNGNNNTYTSAASASAAAAVDVVLRRSFFTSTGDASSSAGLRPHRRDWQSERPLAIRDLGSGQGRISFSSSLATNNNDGSSVNNSLLLLRKRGRLEAAAGLRRNSWVDTFMQQLQQQQQQQQQQRHSDFRLQQCLHFSTQADEKKATTTAASKIQQQQQQQPVPPSPRLAKTKVPTPPSAPPPHPSALDKLRKTTPKGVLHKGMDLTVSVFKATVGFVLRLPGNVFFYVTHPDELKQAFADIKKIAKDEVNHYWVGFKLLWADMQTARNLVGRTLQGSTLTRRERNQLLRTVTDLFRLVPFSMFILIPFMEFALPVALKLFPNLLPSTFQDSLKSEENMKRELQSRIAMAQFFQETMEGLANEQKRKATKRKKELVEAGVSLEDAGDTIDAQEDSAASMLEFLEKARNGEMMPPDVIIRYANYFHDDLTLDNMPRMQLINMCKYMGISPYGSEAFLRFQLRHRIRVLKEDDQRILWEGIDSLTKMELREACQERGMRSTGLSKDAYKRSLQQWLDLSVNKNVPISLLIMSRTFFLHDNTLERKAEDAQTKSLAGLADAISGLDKEVVDQVILEVATPEEKTSDPDITKIKLEVVGKQNELIRLEQAAREAATKRKETEKSSEVPPAEELPADEGAAAVAKTTPEAEPKVEFIDSAGTEHYETTVKPETEEKEEERDLSTEEMDAISQLVSDDPVSKERAELERIKAAMRSETDEETLAKAEAAADDILVDEGDIAELDETSRPATSDKVDFGSAIDVDALHEKVAKEAAAAALSDMPSEVTDHTHATEQSPSDGKEGKEGEEVVVVVEEEEEEEEDPVVAKLKKRIESMVDKIEGQLSQVQVKIGDKLHFLDKDRDGVLSPEEMAEVLQQVLKRKITHEEATEIASAMDENRDGVFTVDELIKWIDQHKLVKFVEEGRDADMDRMIESYSSDQPPKEESLNDQQQREENVENK